jgi:mannose-6-phosphate isomerase-like protein (cupin superfamily)
MNRIVFAFVSFAMLVGLLVARGSTSDAASSVGTPIASPETARTPLASGLLAALPPAPALVGLARVTYAPGAGEQIGIGPYGDLIYVESGELTIRTDGMATVTRSDSDTQSYQEQLGSGTAFVVGEGDSTVVPGGFPVEIRNAGQEEAVLLVGFVGIVEGDPAGRPADPAGVVQQLLGMGMTDAVPAAPGSVALDSVAIEAGASLPIADGASALTLIAVDSDNVTLICDAPLTVFRTAGPPTQVPAGGEVAIGMGDSVLLPMGASGEIRNAGSDPAAVMTLTVASVS